MAEAPRLYAGLDVTWPDATSGDDDLTTGLVLSELDEFQPSAIEYLPSGLRVFFPSSELRAEAAAHLDTVARPDLVARPELQGREIRTTFIDIPDDHWAERSQAALKAVRVGALTVAPPWDVPVDGSTTIVIQPSMGFGTGHHASTRLCLRLLQESPVAGASVLDVGTGSGVLAIAAAQLGAASVTAIDFDADAIASAREGAALNHVEDAIDIRQVDLERESFISGQPFSLILANLTGGLLVRIAPRLCDLATRGGTIIVSGVMRDEERAVVDAFSAAGATTAARLVEDTDSDWVGLQFKIS